MPKDELVSRNPFTGQIIALTPVDSAEQIMAKVNRSKLAFSFWRQTDVNQRCEILRQISNKLSASANECAVLMATEMGKPVKQAKAEVLKSALVCSHYAEVAPVVLKDSHVSTNASQSFIRNEPLGPLLAIMPWNFPFWQVFRFLAPAIAAGNTVLLKHASNVQLSSLKIAEVCRSAGLPEGVFEVLHLPGSAAQSLISDVAVKGVTFTGSNAAGMAVGRAAGEAIKPVILELGGSNAFIVLDDAELEKAVSDAIIGRFQNNGQSCIAAKRILVHESLYIPFCRLFEKSIRALKAGDPLDENTDIGPMVSPEAAAELEMQVAKSLSLGAQMVCGGQRSHSLFTPTLLVSITSDMPVWRQETFGPVAAVRSFSTWDEAVRLSNESKFGLGVSVYTSNPDFILKRLHEFEEGAVFVNSIVKSDPQLPFGGVKASGIGRELGPHGLLSFVNVKSIFVA